MICLYQKGKENWGSPASFQKIKRVENYPDFDKLAHVIQHNLQGFIVKNIEGESQATEANGRLLRQRLQMLTPFSQY